MEIDQLIIPIKKFVLGTFESNQVEIKCSSRVFSIRFPDPDPDLPIITLNVGFNDLSKVDTKFEEDSNFIRIFIKPSIGSYLAGKVPKGFRFVWNRTLFDESRFLIQLSDDIDDNMRIAIERSFTPNGATDTEDSMLARTVSDDEIPDSHQYQCMSQTKKERARDADMNDCNVPKKQSKVGANDFIPFNAEIGCKVFGDDDSTPSKRELRSKTRENNTCPYVQNEMVLVAEENRESTEDESKPKKKDKKKAPSRNPDFDRFDDLQQLLIYGDVEIRMEDWKCLDRREMLTSPIINLYLQHLHSRMSEDLRDRVHIYSTNFYTMYSVDASFAGWNQEASLNAAEKRYNRVQGLPCNTDVNIFEKDFVVFPCHDNEHWFLTIACYPKLSGAVTMDGTIVEDMQKRWRDMKNPDVGEPMKSSVILTFDSVQGSGARRTKAMKYIRQFLLSEYNAKYKNDFPFVSNDVISCSVHSPQQSNTVDCGLFLLENMEQFFFKNPIIDFRTPMKRSDWFNPDTVGQKREEIVAVLKGMMLLERGELPELPQLSFHEFSEDIQLIEENCNNNNEEFNNNNDNNAVDNNKMDLDIDSSQGTLIISQNGSNSMDAEALNEAHLSRPSTPSSEYQTSEEPNSVGAKNDSEDDVETEDVEMKDAEAKKEVERLKELASDLTQQDVACEAESTRKIENTEEFNIESSEEMSGPVCSNTSKFDQSEIIDLDSD